MKQIFIHIGPPKTGTSAIQSWLCNNADYLYQQGIYYPPHDIDGNKISPGNVLSIYDRQKDNSLQFSENKVKALLKSFNSGSCHTMLLSSEIFFRECEQLSKVFKQAKFIVYIRSPLEFLESVYNQSVKRHGNTEKIQLPINFNGSVLKRLEGIIDTVGEDRFYLRFYGEKFFVGNNIIKDFISIFGLDVQQIPNEIVNQSYSFEAIELKRWLNKFDLKGLNGQLDRALQAYVGGSRRFSLFPPQKFAEFKRRNTALLRKFLNKFNVNGSGRFLHYTRSVNQNEYFAQEDTWQCLAEVTLFIFEQHNALYFEICNRIKNKNHTGTDKYYFDIFCLYGNEQNGMILV